MRVSTMKKPGNRACWFLVKDTKLINGEEYSPIESIDLDSKDREIWIELASF